MMVMAVQISHTVAHQHYGVASLFSSCILSNTGGLTTTTSLAPYVLWLTIVPPNGIYIYFRQYEYIRLWSIERLDVKRDDTLHYNIRAMAELFKRGSNADKRKFQSNASRLEGVGGASVLVQLTGLRDFIIKYFFCFVLCLLVFFLEGDTFTWMPLMTVARVLRLIISSLFTWY